MSLVRRVLGKVKRETETLLFGPDILQHIQKRCETERHGSEHAGWTICPKNLNEQSIVYSLGVGDDISFDIALIEKFGVNVYAFDPTPKCLAWIRSQELPGRFRFYEYAVSDHDGTATFYPPDDPEWVSYTISQNQYQTQDRAVVAPIRSLPSLMTELGHKHIDLLKMDIEGAEYAVIKDIVGCGVDVSQLVVEFHHRFKDIGIDQTRNAIRLLNNSGYKTFAISPSAEEYSFIRERSRRRWFTFVEQPKKHTELGGDRLKAIHQTRMN